MTPGSTIAHYKITSKLGEGGMGAVYRATDTKLNRDVAIKVLPASLAGDAQYMARFEREAQVLASLNHPNIAAIYGIEAGAIVMELVEGDEPHGSLPLETALDYARQIAAGLEAAHEKGVIHRDLKPANIKVTPEGTVKLLDFGLAKATEASAGAAASATMSPTLSLAMTQAGMILGTAAYMAPEQARGHVVDRRADVWAFGAVFFELLSGTPAFPGDTVTGEARLALEEYLADPGAAIDAPASPAVVPPARKPWLWMGVSASLLIALTAVLATHLRETPPAERVLRYNIPLPDRAELNSFAISPDGRQIAISAIVDGKRQILLRSLETLVTREVRGSDDGGGPFWSPDGRALAFFANGKLKRVGLDGSPPVVICDASGPTRGGAWSASGTIVFSSRTGADALKRVSAAGGLPVALPAQERRDYPVFLPDGRRYLYLKADAAGFGIHLGSLDPGTNQRILEAQSSALWAAPIAQSASAHLIFQTEGALMAQPFNPGTLQPVGEIFPIAEQVALQGSRAQASVSDNGVLVYWSGTGTTSQLTWYDRSGKDLGSVTPPGLNIGLALSPDEKTVAIARSKTNPSSTDIWFHDLARGVDSRFTLDATRSRAPVWSPDARRLVYTSSRGGGTPNLYLRDTSGSGQDEMLLPPRGARYATDWSRDGRTLIWEETGKGFDLWTLDMQGERKAVPFAVSDFDETQPQISPDSHWVAFTTNESGRYEVYVRPFPSGPGKWRISTDGGELPRWRGDGKEILYLGADRKLMSVPVKPVLGAALSLSAGIPESLFAIRLTQFTSGFNNYPYAVAADGKRFLAFSPNRDDSETQLTVVVNWLAAVKR